MSNLFDEMLTLKIKEAFENHNEHYNPDNWKMLKRKIQNRKRKKIVYFIKRLAAVVAIIFTLISVKLTYDTDEITIARRIDFENNYFDNTNNQANINKQVLQKEQDSIITFADKENKFLSNNHSMSVPENITALKQENLVKNEDKITSINKELSYPTTKSSIESTDSVDIIPLQHTDNIIDDNNSSIIVTDIQKKSEASSETDIFKEEKKDDKNINRIDFGISVSSNINYAAGYSINNRAFGMGTFLNYNIKNHLNLETGIQISQTNFSQNNNMLKESNIVYMSNVTAATISIDHKIKLVCLEIPINLQYELKNICLNLGISSLAYITDKKQYTQITTIQKSDSLSMQTDNINYIYEDVTIRNKSFSEFDLAKLLNIAVSYKVHFKNYDMLLEPQIKLPLGEMSSENIAFYSGGLAIKFSF